MDSRLDNVEVWLQNSQPTEMDSAQEMVQDAHFSPEEARSTTPEEDEGTSSTNLDKADDECIPGVPEDVVLEIISRAPRGAAFSFRHVSKAWKKAAASDVIRHNRAAKGNLEQWIFVLPEFPKGTPFRAFDPNQNTWHILPPIPLHASSPQSDGSLSSRSASSTTSSPMTSPDTSPASSPPRFGADAPSLEGFACAAVSGKLLVIGGSLSTPAGDGKTQKSVTSAVWEFDPSCWSWRTAPGMNTKRGWASAATVHDRFVVVSGGQGEQGFLKSVEVFDSVERTWCHVSSMTSARCSHRSVVVGGKLFVVAGEVERHDVPHLQPRPVAAQPAQLPVGGPLGVFRSIPARLRPGNFFRPVAAGQLVGRRNLGNASMEVYDLETDSWTYLPDSWLNGSKVPCPVAAVGGKLYAVHRSSVHVFDEETATWQFVGDTPGRDSQGRPLQVAGFGVEEVAGKLLLFGGVRDTWIGRNRLTQQNLGTVYSWQPPEVPRGAGEGQESYGVRSMFRVQPQNHSIMLWKDLPAIIGAGGPILASAVVTF